MTVLWFAFGIYIIGIAVVLFLRPNIMFRPGKGTWKEFGISNTGSYTVFPFWLFTLVWAILSYVFATLGAVFFAGLTLKSVQPDNFIRPISQAPVANAPEAPKLPGYYVLETPVAGQPKYVYFGTSPPTAANLHTDSR
jgi:hypothetical protein